MPTLSSPCPPQWAPSLPAAHAGTSVGVDEVRCAKPECPIETVLTVQLPKPKQFTLRKPLASVARAEVAGLMEAWGAMLERGRAVQAWAEQALPKPVAGSRVLVDEVEGGRDIHTSERLETHLHVLATPPWSMNLTRPSCPARASASRYTRAWHSHAAHLHLLPVGCGGG